MDWLIVKPLSEYYMEISILNYIMYENCELWSRNPTDNEVEVCDFYRNSATIC